jgi:hypothetical protein
LLVGQGSYYASVHRDRRNLAIHIATNPLFIAGLLAVPLGLATKQWVTAVVGVILMPLVVFVQGRLGHPMEKEQPPALKGPLDVVSRLFAEQLVTFPRYVLSGKLSEAWDATDSPRSSASA